MNRDNILALIKSLYPPISTMYTDSELYMYIDICMPIVATQGAHLSIQEQELACALLVLDFCLAGSITGTIVSEKKIKDASISYSESTISKWRSLYNELISGTNPTSEDALVYKGI